MEGEPDTIGMEIATELTEKEIEGAEVHVIAKGKKCLLLNIEQNYDYHLLFSF